MIILEEFRKLPLYKIVPMESDFTEIAVTDDPAIQEYFLLFNDQSKFQFNDDKMIIKGPVMIPNVPIYRNDNLGERFVVYDEDGVKLASKYFMKNGLKFNFSHSDEHLDIDLIESYFTEEINDFNLPKGSWIISAKVNSNKLWNDFKSKKTGFSVQFLSDNNLIGIQDFNFELINNKKQKNMEVKEKLLNFINEMLFNDESVIEPTPEVIEAPVIVESPEVIEEKFIDEPVIEEPVIEEPVIEEPVVEEIDIKVKDYIDQKFDELKQMIIDASNKDVIEEMKKQIEEFGNQPTVKPIVEEINSVLDTDNKYGYLKNIKK